MNPIVDIAEYDPDEFQAWSWFVPTPSHAISLTIFGDWIFQFNNAVHLFSPSAARTFEIATVVEEIDWALENVRERAPWLHPELIDRLAANGVTRKQGHIFHVVTPLFLGGQPDENNLQQLDIGDYFTGMQKLLRNFSSK